MPLITVHVGQCGNQVGAEFWRFVSLQLAAGGSKAAQRGLSEFVDFRQDVFVPRAVLVDSEPKAIQAVVAADPGGLLSRAPALTGHSGRGNNWAHGYRQPGEPGGGRDSRAGEGHCLSGALAAVRREVERCTSAPDILVILSLAGGTGSGLGSRLLECLRSNFPDLYIAAAAFAPRPAGDTPVQSLNVVMATQFLREYCDAVFLFQNAELLRVMEERGARGGAESTSGGGGGGGGPGAGGAPRGDPGSSRVDMRDLNCCAAQALAGALFPTDTPGLPSPLRGISADLCPDPRAKFLECYSAPVPPVGSWKPGGGGFGGGGGGGGGAGLGSAAAADPQQLWNATAMAAAAAFPRFDALDGNRPVTATASLLVLRGAGATSAAQRSAQALLARRPGGSLASPVAAVVPWQPADAALVARATTQPLLGTGGGQPPSAAAAQRPQQLQQQQQSRCATIVSNRSSCVGLLSSAAERASTLVEQGAFVHWFERYGCPRDALRDAAEAVSDIVETYREYHGHAAL